MTYDHEDLQQYRISRQGRFSSAVFTEMPATEHMAQEFMQQAAAIREYMEAGKVEATLLLTSKHNNGKWRQTFQQYAIDMDVGTLLRLRHQAEELEERAQQITDTLRYGDAVI